MEIGILSLNQCICIERKAECFASSSLLHRKCQGRIRPRHRIALNRLTLLLNGQVSAQDALDYDSPSDLPWKQRGVPLELALEQEIQPTKEQKLVWDWVNQTVPARRPELETGGLHEQHMRRGAYEVTITRSRNESEHAKPNLTTRKEKCKMMTSWRSLKHTWQMISPTDRGPAAGLWSSEARATQVEQGSETQSEEDDSDIQSGENDSDSESEEEMLTEVLQIVDKALNETNYRIGPNIVLPEASQTSKTLWGG